MTTLGFENALQDVHNVTQSQPSEFHGAVAELEFDTAEAAPSGYDAFADLVQMAVKEDPSLAHTSNGMSMCLPVYKDGKCACNVMHADLHCSSLLKAFVHVQ